jgi:hypothetical protein
LNKAIGKKHKVLLINFWRYEKMIKFRQKLENEGIQIHKEIVEKRKLIHYRRAYKGNK